MNGTSVSRPHVATAAAISQPRRRSTVLLLLYVLASMGTARVVAEAGSTAEKLGALSLPMAFLAFGTYYAFKDKGKVTRVVSVILVALVIASFTLGLVRGLSGSAG